MKQAVFFVFFGVIYFILSISKIHIPNAVFSLIITILCLVYYFGFKNLDFRKISPKTIVIISIIFAIILFTRSQQLESDITNYILGARVAFLGHLNPYVTPYSEFKSDNLYGMFKDYGWRQYSYAYSPLLLYVSGALLHLSGGNIWINIFLFRILFFLTFIASVYIMRKLTDDPRTLYLYAINPIILNELVREAHVESLLILLLLSGLYLFKRGKYFLAYLLFLALLLIKIYFLLFIPFFLLFLFKLKKPVFKTFILFCISGLIILIIFYLPFWRGMATFSTVSELLGNSSYQIITFNFLSVLLMPLVAKLYPDPYQNYAFSGKMLGLIGIIIIIFIAYKLFKDSKSEIFSFVKYISAAYFVFLFFLVNWFFPHYATVLLLLLTLLASYKLKLYSKLTLILSLYCSLYYMILRM